jgi:uncharacterized membrane protein YebE (DUF533 family)
MAGIGDLISVLMQGGMTDSGTGRVGNAMGNQGLGGAGGFLDQILGSAGGGQQPGSDVLKSAMDALKGAGRTATQNPMAAGGIGAILGGLLGGGGDSLKGALGGGALAMLAGLAFKALQNARAPQGGTPSLAGPELPVGLRLPANAQEARSLEDRARLVLKGMINAAKADGQIDRQEVERISGKLQESGVDPDLQKWVMEEMQGPLDMDGLVREIPDQQVAAEVYAASLFAVEVDTQGEKRYLADFAARTGLDQRVTQELHRAVGVLV